MKKVLAVAVLCVMCFAGTASAQPSRNDGPRSQPPIPHALSRDKRMPPPDFRSGDKRPPHGTDGHRPPKPKDDNRR